MIIRVQGCGKGKQGGTNGRWACEIRIVACILDWKSERLSEIEH